MDPSYDESSAPMGQGSDFQNTPGFNESSAPSGFGDGQFPSGDGGFQPMGAAPEKGFAFGQNRVGELMDELDEEEKARIQQVD